MSPCRASVKLSPRICRAVKWLQEVLLQRYWQERCHEDEYAVEGRRVLGGRMNPTINRYPDIIENRLEGEDRPVPAEVEWTTNDFRLHDHDLTVLTEAGGFLIVYKRTQAFPTPQVELHLDDFRDWLDKSRQRLLDDTLEDIEVVLKRQNDPRGWIVWRSHSVANHLEIGLKAGLWGFPNNMNPNRLASAQAIKKGDLLIFVGPWKKRTGETAVRGGRISDEQFMRGLVDGILAFPVTKSYFADDTVVWPAKGEEVWRHRVEIDAAPVFEGREVPTSKALLGSHLADVLRRVMIGRSDPLEIPEYLVV